MTIPTNNMPEPEPREEGFRPPSTMMIYGPTGTYKTTQVARAAKYVYETTGLPTRYLFTDMGGITHIQKYVDAGIIDLMPIPPEIVGDNLYSLIRAISRGHWGPITWAKKPGTMTDIPHLANPAGTQMVTVNTPRGKVSYPTAKLSEPVGAYAVDSLYGLSDRILRSFMQAPKKVGQDVSYSFAAESMVEGGKEEKFASPGMSHYGFAQTLTVEFVTNMAMMPVRYVFYTSLEGVTQGEKTLTAQAEYGPAIVGSALTSKIPAMIGDLFHCETVARQQGPGQKVGGPGNVVRAYFDKHQDSERQTIWWPAKPRFTEDCLEELWAKWPGGYIELAMSPESENNIAGYMRFRDEMERKKGEELRGWKEKMMEARR